jgi:hypothetical protein
MTDTNEGEVFRAAADAVCQRFLVSRSTVEQVISVAGPLIEAKWRERVAELEAEFRRRGISIIGMTEWAGAHLCRAEKAEAELATLRAQLAGMRASVVAELRERADLALPNTAESLRYVATLLESRKIKAFATPPEPIAPETSDPQVSDQELLVANVAQIRQRGTAALRVSAEHYLWIWSEINRAQQQRGWLIEAGWSDPSKPEYFCGSYDPWKAGDAEGHHDAFDRPQWPFAQWTTDNLGAVRFVREADARCVAASIPGQPDVRICEHSWFDRVEAEPIAPAPGEAVPPELWSRWYHTGTGNHYVVTALTNRRPKPPKFFPTIVYCCEETREHYSRELRYWPGKMVPTPTRKPGEGGE